MQQLTFTLKLTQSLTLPLAHNSMLQGMVYSLMSHNAALSQQVHDTGFGESLRPYKLFVFGRLEGKRRVEGKQITYYDSVQFTVRSVLDDIITAMEQALLQKGCVQLGDTILPVIGASSGKQYFLQTDPTIRMLSPVCVHRTEERKTVYYAPGDPCFSELVLENYHRKHQAVYGFPSQETISITPVKPSSRDKCVTQCKGIYVTAYMGMYQLCASPRATELLYYAGIGSKNPQGFGLFEVLL